MNKFLLWVVFNIPLGRLAPHVLGLAIGIKPVKTIEKKEGAEE